MQKIWNISFQKFQKRNETNPRDRRRRHNHAAGAGMDEHLPGQGKVAGSVLYIPGISTP